MCLNEAWVKAATYSKHVPISDLFTLLKNSSNPNRSVFGKKFGYLGQV